MKLCFLVYLLGKWEKGSGMVPYRADPALYGLLPYKSSIIQRARVTPPFGEAHMRAFKTFVPR